MDSVALIPLSRGLNAMVDEADFPLVSRYKWHASPTHSGLLYANACLGISQAKELGRRHIKMHRLLLGFPGCHIDHKNGNGLDNRRSNLRFADDRLNQQNKRKRRPMTSRYKGVSWHAGSGKWQAFLMVGGKNVYLGTTADEAEAATLYDTAARREFGEFAQLNLAAS